MKTMVWILGVISFNTLLVYLPERIKFPGRPLYCWVYEKSRSSVVVLVNQLKYRCFAILIGLLIHRAMPFPGAVLPTYGYVEIVTPWG